MKATPWWLQLFVFLALHMFHYPLDLNLEGKLRHAILWSFVLINTKYTSKTLGVHTDIHAHTLCLNVH